MGHERPIDDADEAEKKSKERKKRNATRNGRANKKKVKRMEKKGRERKKERKKERKEKKRRADERIEAKGQRRQIGPRLAPVPALLIGRRRPLPITTPVADWTPTFRPTDRDAFLLFFSFFARRVWSGRCNPFASGSIGFSISGAPGP